MKKLCLNMITQQYRIYSICFLFFSYLSGLHGQINTFQSFTISAASFNPLKSNANQYEWRLDLGVTSLELNQTKAYFFTAGMLQPNINRFKTINAWKQYDPLIQLRYQAPNHAIVLFSSAPDLIIFGFKLFDSNGRLLKTNATKIASSYLAHPIDLTGYSNGIYYIIVYYLPESIYEQQTSNYWTKTLKLLRQ